MFESHNNKSQNKSGVLFANSPQKRLNLGAVYFNEEKNRSSVALISSLWMEAAEGTSLHT